MVIAIRGRKSWEEQNSYCFEDLPYLSFGPPTPASSSHLLHQLLNPQMPYQSLVLFMMFEQWRKHGDDLSPRQWKAVYD